MTSLRRANKSHKVPNVKLRPALPSSSRPRKMASHDSGFESEHESAFIDTCPRPFRGVVLCATGLDDKTSVFKEAIELGAQPLHDLTDKVTHVLAVEPGSAKYKCAIKFKLPIMHPAWITESYEAWLRGDDIDFEESLKTYRLPIFSGVVLCISGIEDEATRVKIHKLVTSEGGTYVKDITRPVKVTHLLCSSGINEGSEKVQYAQRFNKNGEANIHIVWEEWFWDSLRVKGCCDEEAYAISKPRLVRHPTPEPEVCEASSSEIPVQRSQPPCVSQHQNIAADDLLCQGDEEGPLLAARLPVITMQAWEGMLRSRGFERRGNNFYSSQGQNKATDRAPSPPKTRGEPPRRCDTDNAEAQQPSILASFRRTDSFAPLTKDTSTQRQRQPFRRTPTVADVTSFHAPETGSPIVQEGRELPLASSSRAPLAPAASHSHNEAELEKSEVTKDRAFEGVTIRAIGEVWRPDVRDAVSKAGGRLVPEDSDELVDYIVVRLVSGSKLYRDETDWRDRPKYRTECWLERCLNEDRVCAPEEHLLFVPLRIETPVVGAESIRLSYSGLNDEEICWVKRLARVLGITIPDTLSRRSTHLLCPSRSGVKFEKAQEWGIVVVDMTWLHYIAVTGLIASTSGEQKSPRESSEGVTVEEASVPERHKNQDEGKTVIFQQPDRDRTTITNQLSPHSQHQDVQPAETDDRMAPLIPNGLLGLGGSDAAQQAQEQEMVHTQPAVQDGHEAAPSHRPRPPVRFSTPSISRRPSGAELREDMRTTQIPSSETPSPVKASSKPTSPAKLDTEVTAGLLDSITFLVKRPSTEEDELEREKKPKRARPISRSTSTAAIVQGDSSTAARVLSTPNGVRQVFDPFMYDEAGQLVGAGRTQDESMCVTYEDPEQRVERQRLMKLLEAKSQNTENEVQEVEAGNAGETQSSGSSRGKGTRKSQRKAPARRRTRAS